MYNYNISINMGEFLFQICMVILARFNVKPAATKKIGILMGDKTYDHSPPIECAATTSAIATPLAASSQAIRPLSSAISASHPFQPV
jgi:hypothetical protein